MSNYYCLVAGLPDVDFDGGKCNFSIEQFREEIYPELSKEDLHCIDTFFYAWDNENILRILSEGNDIELSRKGCFSLEELVDIIGSVKEGDSRKNDIPSYLYDFLAFYFDNEVREDIIWSDVLSRYYFDYATKNSNEFVASWFEYNLNVNNILVALLARKYKMNVAECVIGDNEVADSLRTSGARDFGLGSSLDYFDSVVRLSENDDFREREHLLDELRWKWLEDNSVFNYFTVERLFVFLQKLDIIARWSLLDETTGMQKYNELIEGLKSGAVLA